MERNSDINYGDRLTVFNDGDCERMLDYPFLGVPFLRGKAQKSIEEIQGILGSDPCLSPVAQGIGLSLFHGCFIRGIHRSAREVASAIAEPLLLEEVYKLDNPVFWRINEWGQIVIGDGGAQPPRDSFGPDEGGFSYLEARTRASRIAYSDNHGKVTFIEGRGFTKNANGDIWLEDANTLIPASKVLYTRGLPTLHGRLNSFGTLEWTGGDYGVKNRGGYLDFPFNTWIESGPGSSFCAGWSLDRLCVHSQSAFERDPVIGFRSVVSFSI